MVRTSKKKAGEMVSKCRIKVSLSSLVEVINFQKGRFNTGELKIHKDDFYKELIENCKKSSMFSDETNPDEKIQLIADNISENLLVGYAENLKRRFYMVANIDEAGFMQRLSNNTKNFIKIISTSEIKRLNLYMIEYEILENLELEVYSMKLEELLATYL